MQWKCQGSVKEAKEVPRKPRKCQGRVREESGKSRKSQGRVRKAGKVFGDRVWFTALLLSFELF